MISIADRHDSMLSKSFIILSVILVVEGVDNPTYAPYQNIALHKSANQSGTEKYFKHPASWAVDGNRSNVEYMGDNSCIHTNEGGSPRVAWWTVDLGFITDIHEVLITYRSWKNNNKYSNGRLAGFSIFVSNTSYFRNGTKCFIDSGDLPDISTTSYPCNATGQFLTVYNERLKDVHYPSNYSDFAILELCEVEIPGCMENTFGANCSQTCFCSGVTCDYVSGVCDGGCVSGYTGISCNETCSAGYFGQNCTQECPHCGGNQTCNNTGDCIQGCEDGYFTDDHLPGCQNKCGECQGKRCEQGGHCPSSCVPGFYSTNCTSHCPANCLHDLCVQNSGVCMNCSDGYFGIFCEKRCPENCEPDICDYDSGYCSDCSSGWHGDKCDMKCKHCRGNTACYHNGTCKGECEVGYAKNITGECVKTCIHCDKAEKEQTQSQTTFVALGTGGGVLVVLVILAVIVIVYRKKRNTGKRSQVRYRTEDTEFKDHIYTNTQVGNTNPHISLNKECEEINDKRQEASSSTQISELGKPETVIYNNVGKETDGIKVDTFQNYVRMNNREKELENEYKDIPYGAIYPHDEAKKTLNIPRNRFKAIFPYDHSRVILDSRGQKSDYINASYIDDTKDPQKYIATQGPLTNTIADFWRMTWEKKVDKIVMLTNLKEVNKTKCEKYWPDPNKPERHDIFEISCMDERLFSYYVVRNLRIQHKKSKEQRHVWHFHFTTWPDHGTPDPLLLVLFHKRVVNANGTSNGPVIVHCSAGVGRTGTYIGLDALVKQGRETGQVNVKNYVEKMRKDRMNMVQTDQQYIVLHEALAEALELNETMIPMDKFPSKWRKSLKDPRPTNQKKLKQEYDSLRSFKKPHDPHDCKTAISNANKKKNRNDSIVASDKYRPYLSPAGHGRTDYINAIILPTHTKRNGYIVTQRPMVDTVLDFWQLVEEHEISNIVLFEKDSDEKTEFYPSTDVMEIENAIVQKRGETNLLNSIVHIELLIVYNDVNDDRLIRLYKVDMRKNQLPTAMQVLKTNESLLSLRQAQTDGPLLVVSQEGTAPCDVYCTVTNIQESMKIDNEIDVFQTARQLQLRRPEFFGSYGIYELCFEIINEHLNSDTVYFNM